MGIELAIVLLAAVALHFYFEGKAIRRIEETIQTRQSDLYYYATGEEVDDADEAHRQLVRLKIKYDEAAGTQLPIKNSARTVWRQLWQAINDFRNKYPDIKEGDETVDLLMVIERLDIKQSTRKGNESLKTTLSGRIRNALFLNKLQGEMKKREIFKAVLSGPIIPIPLKAGLANLPAGRRRALLEPLEDVDSAADLERFEGRRG